MVELTVSVALITLNPPAVNVMLVVFSRALRPGVATIESVTVPVKPLTAITLMRVVPVREGKKSKAALCHAPTRGPMEVREADTVILLTTGAGVTETKTPPGTVLDRVAEPLVVVPVTVRVKLAAGSAVQLTDSAVPKTPALQPVEAEVVENVTLPANALIATKDSVEV
jgi:hypothetical protein